MKQLTFFDLIPDEDNKAADICESCRYNENGCCSYDEPLGRYCVEGDAYELKVPDTAPQFPESDFAEIVDYLNYKLGLNFQREKWATEYEREAYSCKVNKRLRFTIARGRFDPDINGGAEYISCGWQTSTAGGGSPIEDTQAAKNYFASTIRAYDNGLIE